MKVFYSDAHALHQPRMFLKAGQLAPNPEIAARAHAIAGVLAEAGFELVAPTYQGLDAVLAVHDEGLVRFLETGYQAWSKLPGAGAEIVANTHPGPRFRHRPESVVGLAGFYTQDAACPIAAGTWQAAVAAAGCAADAALAVMGGAASAYALCRPPGHHATRAQVGGFCYLNNAAIAAQLLRGRFERVAILDVDVHHGNGTQDIFYDRSDVFFGSIHGDPNGFYPFFSGTPGECGEGDGLGFNLNVPFPVGSGDDEVLRALASVLAAVRSYAPQALVLSLGFDAHEKDPHGAHRVSTPGFMAMAQAISGLGLPCVVVQEGGYLHEELGSLARDFLRTLSGHC
ncbi:histone deacetylase family protein [Polaromonas sp.]|uniref:histone deacetylase family protein n=1 Tax=Polaromonas sp. TaxID=1869339 RepID=UPI002488D823|nr:histone deacetylase family protein [Polaromonas sp.]MDI1340442.1 histone deacetylase family protein [Polaromonas sp.]